MVGADDAWSALYAANTEARVPADTCRSRPTRAAMVSSRVYCWGACSWKSCPRAAPSTSHSRVPRTNTPSGTAWQWGTTATGMAWNAGWARSRSRGEGFLGVGGSRILASPGNGKVDGTHYRLLGYGKACHVERAGSKTPPS